MIDNIKVGKAISELRKKQNLTQKDLADKLKVSDKAVSKWERGSGLPDISLLSTLTMILDTDVESLLEGNSNYQLKEKWIGLLCLNNKPIELNTKIHDKTLLEYLIGYFLLAGIKDIYLLSEKEIDISENIRKNCEKLKIICIKDINNIPKENVMLINSPLFIYGQNVTRSFQKSMERKEGITVLSLPEHLENNINIIYDSNHKVVDNSEKSIEASYQYNGLPVLFFPKAFINSVNNKKTQDLVNELTNKGYLYTEPMFRGVIYIPLNDQDDINDASDIVRIIQKRDYKIGDLKEIAFRRGL